MWIQIDLQFKLKSAFTFANIVAVSSKNSMFPPSSEQMNILDLEEIEADHENL